MSERKKLGDTGWIDPLDRDFANYGKIILYEHMFRYKLVAYDILELFNRSEWKKEINILDIGSGTGYGSRILFSSLYDCLKTKKIRVRYSSIDVDEKAISEGKKYLISNYYFSSSLQVGNVFSLSRNFEKNSVDIVIFFGVIEHLTQPKLSLTEIEKVLRRGGRLYLSTPNREYPIRLLYNKISGISVLSNPTHVFEFNWSELRDFTERIKGWKVVKLFGQNILPPRAGDLILNLIPRHSHFNAIMTPGQYLPRCSRDFIAVLEKE